MLPPAYTHLASMFLKRVRYEGLDNNIILKEWQKGKVNEEGGWTYHAKGLWITFPSSHSPGAPPTPPEKGEDPSLTVVGSSNYTKRSYELDLEANVIIATSDPGLRRRLGEEVEWLQEYAKDTSEAELAKPDRKASIGVKLSMWLVRVLGGAL